MTKQEWWAKRPEAMAEYQAAVAAGETLDWEAWRVKKGYVVDHQAGVRLQA